MEPLKEPPIYQWLFSAEGYRKLIAPCMHAGDTSQLAAITEAVAGKENLAEDARALAEKAIQLAALLPRVRAKQAQRDAAAADSAAAANPKRALSLNPFLLQEREMC